MTDNEKAIGYLEKHIEQLRMKMNVLSLNKYNKEIDHDEIFEKLKEENEIEINEKFDKFIKYKGPKPSSKELCISAYESVLFNERAEERKQLNA